MVKSVPVLFFATLSLLTGALCVQVATAKETPVSVSYENIVHCFPEFASKKIEGGVQLDRFKELIDSKFVDIDSTLRYRKIRFKTDGGETRLLTKVLTKPKTYELRLEKWTEADGRHDLPLPVQAQRINPTQKQIDQILVGTTVLADDSAFEANKAQSLEIAFIKGLQGIQQLDLRDPARKRSVSCNEEKDLGTICTCSKK